MSAPCDISSTLPQESTEDVNDREPAFTAPGSAPSDGTFFASPQETVSSSALDVLWCKAFEHYGLQRPTDVRRSMSFVSFSNLLGTRIHVLVQLPGLVP